MESIFNSIEHHWLTSLLIALCFVVSSIVKININYDK